MSDRSNLPRPEPATNLTIRGPSSNRPVRFVVTVAIFCVVAPVVSATITIGGFLLLGFPIRPQNQDGAYIVLGMLAYGLWSAHPLGFLPAAGIGAIIAVRDLFGGTRFFEAAAIGGGIGVLWAFLKAWGKMHELFSQLVVASFLVATIVGWALTRWTRRWA